MKVLLLSTSDLDGGAARATYRLHKGFQSINTVSQMLVQAKHSDDERVITTQKRCDVGEAIGVLRRGIDNLPLKAYPGRDRASYSPQWLPDRINAKVAQLNPDIINLHWVNKGYLQIESLAKFNKPLVWSLHDMWSFTGGCHYSQGCDRYEVSCGACPYLQSEKSLDLSRWVWQRKARNWKDLNLTIVALSSWLAKCAQSSSLFKNSRVETIPNGLNTESYKPVHQKIARKLLNLPLDKKLILFGSVNPTSDKRKGFHLLQSALQSLKQSGWQEDLELVIFGTSQPEKPVEMGFKAHYLGMFSDDPSLALVYSSADIFIAPSIQENLANTVMESLACGTPCVAFRIGGMSDLIEHQKNGYLAEPFKIEDLAQGIVWVLDNAERHQKLAEYARKKVEQEFAIEIQARRYMCLFAEILERGYDKKTINQRKQAT